MHLNVGDTERHVPCVFGPTLEPYYGAVFRAVTGNQPPRVSFSQRISRILLIALGFTNGLSYNSTRLNCVLALGEMWLTNRTVAHWFDIFRDRVVDAAADLRGGEGQIGGPGSIVRVDEALIGRRKYNWGRVVQGICALGMISDDGQFG